MMETILIEGCTLVPMDPAGPQWLEGSLGISDGRIALLSASADEDHRQKVADFCRRNEALQRIDGRGMVVMPGLINTHGHSPMSLMRGYADDMALMRWLNDYIWPFEASLTPQAVELGTQVSIAEMLLGGTTTFADMYWMAPVTAHAAGRSGIRAMISATAMDARRDHLQAEVDELVGIASSQYGGRVGVLVSPHSPYSCSKELLRLCIELGERYSLRLNIHLAESADEIEIIRSREGKTPVEYMRDLGFFDREALAVHCVHLTDGDIEIMRQNNVSVAHNPQSNMKLASGISPVARMMARGVNVSLGTDGPCSNNDLDMWEEMRTASLVQKVATADPCALPAYDTLRMATVCGARALGLQDSVGMLAVGMKADVIMVDMRRPHLSPCYDPVANLVYCAKASDVRMTIVDGRIVASDGRCLTLDQEELCDRINRIR